MSNFAILGVAGYVAPRHLDAIAAGGHRLVAAADPNDAVGRLDRCSLDTEFFRDSEQFAACLRRRRRGPAADRVDYVSICTPNDLHDTHVRLALHADADALCEKPLLIDPKGLDALERLERQTGRRIFTVLQLRLHPVLVALRERLAAHGDQRRLAVEITYVSARGPWYDVSWKGSAARSGGLLMNIGVHLFDLLLWLFGPVQHSELHLNEPRSAGGLLVLRRAEVRWFLSVDRQRLSAAAIAGGATTHRSITIDGGEIEFSTGFRDLHRTVYAATLAGAGFSIADARPSLELVHALSHAPLAHDSAQAHPLVGAGAARR